MNGFKKNNISYDYETAGEQLSLARKKQNLKLKKISKKLNINIEHLESLEKGKFNNLPGGIYREKILKKYSEFLDLNQEEITKSFSREGAINTEIEEKIPSLKKIKAYKFLVFPKLLKSSLIVLVLLICFSYLAFSLNKVVSPPSLVINYPEKNSLILGEKQITISGKTTPEASIYINNKNILKDSIGNFEENINLKKGLNTIIISAQKWLNK
jgi:cytoskeletal protein RodZ